MADTTVPPKKHRTPFWVEARERQRCHQLHEMTTQLARVERQGVTGANARACAMRLEAAALRKDIREAQVLIDRLRRRYLNGDEQAEQRPSG